MYMIDQISERQMDALNALTRMQSYGVVDEFVNSARIENARVTNKMINPSTISELK